MNARARIVLLRAWRIGALVALAVIVGNAQRGGADQRPMPIGIREISRWFPAVRSLDVDVLPSGQVVRDAEGAALGTVLTTSPDGDRILGYAGPSEVLLAVDPDRLVVGAALRRSADTPQHVADLRADARFWGQIVGRPIAGLATGRGSASAIDAVSGATATSAAVVDAIGARVGRALDAPSDSAAGLQFGLHDAALALFLLGGIVLTASRRARRYRTWFRCAVVVYLGVATGELLALSLGAGFARHGVPWGRAPGLVLLALGSLLVPWATGRNPYCGQICPHGVVQEWLGRLARGRVRRALLPSGARFGLRAIPTVLVVVAVIALAAGLPLDLAAIEAFDAWSFGLGAATVIAVGGLVAAAFEPMAYCRYGCATGRVLSLATVPRTARVDRRDVLLGSLLAIAGLLAAGRAAFETLLVELPL